MQCHGCKGSGWVSPNGMNAVLCPVCKGSGNYIMPNNPYTPSYPTWNPNIPYWYSLPQITCEMIKTSSNDDPEFNKIGKPPKDIK